MIKCTYNATEDAYFHTILKAKTVFIVFDQIWPTIIADILKWAFNGPFPITCQKPTYIYTIFQVTHTVHMLFCTFVFLGLRIEGEKSHYEYGLILHFDSKLIMGRVQVSVLNLF